MSSTGTLIVRADAGPSVGFGHAMRCLALAQAWTDRGGDALFVMAAGGDAMSRRLKDDGVALLEVAVDPGSAADAEKTLAIASSRGAPWIVADGYGFGAEYQEALTAGGRKLLVFDDCGHADHYHADLILNQNRGADATLYENRDRKTRLLLGSRFALLGRRFLTCDRRRRPVRPAVDRLLVTMGGSDEPNVTTQVLRALRELPEDLTPHTDVVLGPENPHREEVSRRVAGDRKIRALVNVRNMPELMARADLAVSAGGSTCWELAFMGLPAVVIVLANNQRVVADACDEAGLCISLGWHERATVPLIAEALRALITDPEKREEMSRVGRRTIDGGGAARVLDAMSGGGGDS